MVRSRGGHLGTRFCLEKNFPSIGRRLQLVEIKRREVVHEEALNLATKDEYLGAKNVE